MAVLGLVGESDVFALAGAERIEIAARIEAEGAVAIVRERSLAGQAADHIGEARGIVVAVDVIARKRLR